MKIGFTGSHGTGKTSLMERLGLTSEFKDYALVGSTSRKVKGMGLPINDQATPYSQLLITNMRDYVEEQAGENFISDRTTLDSLAYTLYQFYNVWPKNEETRTVVGVSYTIVRQSIKKYDHIFYFPPFDTVTYDGTRPIEKQYQQKHDGLLRGLINELNVPVTTISPGSIKDRMVQVIGMVQ